MAASDRADSPEADGPLTQTDTVSERFAHPIERVWPILADFGGVGRYMAGVVVREVEGEGVGAVRIIPQGDAVIREKLLSFDAAQHAFSYGVVDPSPLAMSRYVGVVKLTPDGADACRIDWSGSFAMPAGVDPLPQKKGLESFYRSAIAGLNRVLAGKA